jgi:lysophospholipase L1-like esterase
MGNPTKAIVDMSRKSGQQPNRSRVHDSQPTKPPPRRRIVRALQVVQTCWSIFGVALLMFAALESGTRGMTSLFEYLGLRALRQEHRVLLAKETNESSAGDVLETRRLAQVPLRLNWSPYVLWKPDPLDVRVNSTGFRDTWNAPDAANRPQVFTFGGSTMWGAGVGDDATIASHLSQELAKQGLPCSVRNFGVEAFVSTQELILLMRLLARGERPDVVVFYDGINEVGSAIVNQAGGSPVLEAEISDQVRGLYEPGLLQSLSPFVRQLAIHEKLILPMQRKENTTELYEARLARLLSQPAIREYVERNSRSRSSEHIVTELMNQDLLSEVLSIYLSNCRVVHQLGALYGFQSFFYWQPTLFDKSDLSPFEQKLVADAGQDSRLFDLVRQLFDRKIPTTGPVPDPPELVELLKIVRDLGNSFDAPEWHGKTVFVDFAHITSAGNSTIARHIAADLAQLPELKTNPPQPAGQGERQSKSL